MKKQLLFLIHTEYHLLLAIYYLYSNNFLFNDLYENTFLVKAGTKSKRLDNKLNFDSLPIKVSYLDFGKSINEPIDENLISVLNILEKKNVSEFNFFQEQDFFAVIILKLLKTKNTIINLFQDGFKPYVSESLGFTPSIHIHDFKINRYINQNNYRVNDWLSIFKCHRYGFLKGIDNLYLTFPESFPRKHRKNIKKLKFEMDTQVLKIYQKIFNWKDTLLPQRENVIFFLNQPMRDDGSFDLHVLKKLREKYPDNLILIKNHPHTPQDKIELYKSLDNCIIVDSRIPAELFIAILKNSIIVSVCSTAMFVNNPSCSFYFLFNIKENNNIERLNKYKAVNPTEHVLVPKRVEEIVF